MSAIGLGWLGWYGLGGGPGMVSRLAPVSEEPLMVGAMGTPYKVLGASTSEPGTFWDGDWFGVSLKPFDDPGVGEIGRELGSCWSGW